MADHIHFPDIRKGKAAAGAGQGVLPLDQHAPAQRCFPVVLFDAGQGAVRIEIVRIILAELGKPESLITHVADRKGHDRRYAIDPGKAMKELGWAPTTMFADGIKLTIRWYREHMDWMRECTSGEYMDYYRQMYENRK